MGGAGDGPARLRGAEGKKLLGLGRFWAGSDRPPAEDLDALRAEMQAYQVAPAEVDRIVTVARERQNQVRFTVWAENWRAWQVFRRVQRQWRRDGLGGATALEGAVLLEIIGLMEAKRKARLRLFDQASLIERGALQAWAEQRATKPIRKPAKRGR